MRPPLKPAVKTCVSKRRYPDEYVARAVAQSIVISKGLRSLKVYPCGICKGVAS